MLEKGEKHILVTEKIGAALPLTFYVYNHCVEG
jgi:hypothetical protein